MFKCLSFIIVFAFVTNASGESVESYFKVLNETRKGAFGPNMMQGRSSRITYRRWAQTGSAFIFQSAFRNKTAKALLEEHGVYTGNLFATNYYELRAEFILGDRDATHLASTDGVERLIEVSQGNPAVYDRATQIILNWNLEKLYVLKNPNSRIAKGFGIRGVGDANKEREYATEFVNYYVTESDSNQDLMGLVKLTDSSALFTSSNFTTIRDDATRLYENYPNRAIKRIRDNIHNQLTPDILVQIDAYLSANGGPQALRNIRAKIVSYFARGVADINHIAKKAAINTDKLGPINTGRPSLEALADYANDLVAQRNKMMTSEVSLEQKYIYLGYTSVASTFLFEKTKKYVENNRLNGSNLNEVNRVMLSLLYLRGFFNSDVLERYSNVPTDFDGFEAFFLELFDIVLRNIKTPYSPYISKWEQADSAMGGIVDDTLRSSAMGLYDTILEKMD